mmetsp:Transcript_5717/g.7705  ORF Transcript_5717/g.7705 Transcript_5717/m.7705 type:complete len:107 (+) Transcript_5717:232-552(+)
MKTDIPVTAEHERVREFLMGTQAKRSVRSIINSKINKVTKMSGLTQKTTYHSEEEITILGQGQVFGEGRFLQIYERQQKVNEKLSLADKPRTKQACVKVPLQFEDD